MQGEERVKGWLLAQLEPCQAFPGREVGVLPPSLQEQRCPQKEQWLVTTFPKWWSLQLPDSPLLPLFLARARVPSPSLLGKFTP